MLLNYEQFIKTIPTKKAFVLFGNKLTHSISSNIHSKIMKEYDIDGEYYHVEITPEQLCGAINHLKQYFCGANVTIPYKTDIMQYVDECDEVSTRLNSVNTIKVLNGKTYGYNTDIIGIYNSLEKDNIDMKNRKVALLGYGGTANVVIDILAKNECDITIFGRNAEKANVLKNYVLNNYKNAKISVENIENYKDEYELIFNTTPIGMNDLEGKSPIYDFKNAKYVFDCLYNPQITKIIDIANENNIKSRSGLNMLYTQALYAQKIWHDFDVSKANNIYDILANELFQKRLKNRNIVIFGFMGCGKTTISQELSKISGLSLIDTDEFISKNENMKISEIFKNKGEPYFRNLEIECAKKLANLENYIISVGGGFVINNENVDILSKNSVFIFLDIDFNEIQKRISNDPSRPLSNEDTLKELFNTRYSIYNDINSIKITKNSTPLEMVTEIMGKV